VPSAAAIVWRICEETQMAWNKPKIVEVPVSMEVTMYFTATRK
jgi:coenzyme PQQ precursor peptide PqqA